MTQQQPHTMEHSGSIDVTVHEGVQTSLPTINLGPGNTDAAAAINDRLAQEREFELQERELELAEAKARADANNSQIDRQPETLTMPDASARSETAPAPIINTGSALILGLAIICAVLIITQLRKPKD